MACPTCILLKALLESIGVDTKDASTIANTKTVKSYDKKVQTKVKRKASAYSKKYGRAFKAVAGKYQKKNGGWKKDGFRLAQKAAHKKAKKM